MQIEFDQRRLHRPKPAQWQIHANHVNAPEPLRHWLTDRGSLTAKLIAHCDRFRVQRIAQQTEVCWHDEYAAIGLPRPGKVHAREVLLRCDEQPTVYAHTVMPLTADASQWPLFRSLGNRSLGSTLFSDPLVLRGPMQFARLHGNHPAMQRARTLTGQQIGQACFDTALFARRSLFWRHGGVMLVTELFLPNVFRLNRTHVVFDEAELR
jgi:chorismate--pyruvate lyase